MLVIKIIFLYFYFILVGRNNLVEIIFIFIWLNFSKINVLYMNFVVFLCSLNIFSLEEFFLFS